MAKTYKIKEKILTDYLKHQKQPTLEQMLETFDPKDNEGEVMQTSQILGAEQINKAQCLKTLQKIKQSGLSGFSEIVDVKQYIQDLKNEIK